MPVPCHSLLAPLLTLLEQSFDSHATAARSHWKSARMKIRLGFSYPERIEICGSTALQCTVILKNRQFAYGNLFLRHEAVLVQREVDGEVGPCDCGAFGTPPAWPGT